MRPSAELIQVPQLETSSLIQVSGNQHDPVSRPVELSILTRTDTFYTVSSGSTVPGLGSLSGRAIKQLGEAVLNGVDYILVNRELGRIDSYLQLDPPRDVKMVEEMYQTLFQLTHPGYMGPVRARAFKIIMRQVGSMKLKALAAALVRVSSWSETYHLLSMIVECCRRDWSSDNDFYMAGYDAYAAQPKGALLQTDPLLLYLALIALLGSQRHCGMILDLISSVTFPTSDDMPTEMSALTGRLLKRLIKARLRLKEEDSSITDALAVLTSAIPEENPSFVYPSGHVHRVLAGITGIMPTAILTSPIWQQNSPPALVSFVEVFDNLISSHILD
ncbi:hypothetical protein PM082_024424 [Marasmius tenuissimus]|nr:hypothetical protein PM082_024424 [Marasmius tenuissimus]